MKVNELVAKYDSMKIESIKMKMTARNHYQAGVEALANYEAKKKELVSEVDSMKIQSSAIDTLKEIVDKMSQQHINKIVDLLTYGLSTIFFDKKYSVEMILADKRNTKTAEFMLVEESNGEIIKSAFEDGIGGGVIAVTGVILQVYYISLLGLAPVIFVDEGFSQVSSEYIDPLMKFIEELADSKGFIFVLVTHDERLMNRAVKTYKVEEGKISEAGK